MLAVCHSAAGIPMGAFLLTNEIVRMHGYRRSECRNSQESPAPGILGVLVIVALDGGAGS